MVAKAYDWIGGAELDEHSRRKHKILREYFYNYLIVRCQNPAQTKFRLAIVDGFSGGGRYACGSVGSPLIFLEELRRAVDYVNIRRASQGLNSILEVECLLAFNDADAKVTDFLRQQVDPFIVKLREECPRLHPTVLYMSETFEGAYPVIKDQIARGRYPNVLYNLDQCGHSKVDTAQLADIMASTPSVEVFFTFAIQTLLTYLSRTDPERMATQIKALGVDPAIFRAEDGKITNEAWLGQAERLVFDVFRRAARFVSPFSITNPDGWRYWLIHFANSYRARQVYNDVLHGNGAQAHYGRSGLKMLSYDPSQEGALYLFDAEDRARAKTELLDDIPRLISETGDAMDVLSFYEASYNHTPAHKDDIHAAMIESPDLEIITDAGGERRKANTIKVTDTIKLKAQRTFFPVFGVGPTSPIKSKP